MKFVVVFCLIALMSVTAQQKSPLILCGRQLANARVLVCYGAEYVNKRTSSQSLLGTLTADNDKWDDTEWGWSGRRGALSARWSRYKRDGLVNECCLKPCTTDEILNYC